MTQRYLNVAGTAAYLGVTEAAVRRRIQRGELPFIKDGARVRFDIRDLDRFMQARRMAPPEPREGRTRHG